MTGSGISIGFSLGLCMGVALGVALQNVAIGAGFGLSLGVAFSLAYSAASPEDSTARRRPPTSRCPVRWVCNSADLRVISNACASQGDNPSTAIHRAGVEAILPLATAPYRERIPLFGGR